jgi:hypothetical protein
VEAVGQHLDERGGVDRGETLAGVVIVLLEVGLNQGFHQQLLVEGQVTVADEDLAQWRFLVGHPGRHGPDQCVAADEAVVQRQDAEEQVAIAVGVRHVSPGSSDGP